MGASQALGNQKRVGLAAVLAAHLCLDLSRLRLPVIFCEGPTIGALNLKHGLLNQQRRVFALVVVP